MAVKAKNIRLLIKMVKNTLFKIIVVGFYNKGEIWGLPLNTAQTVRVSYPELAEGGGGWKIVRGQWIKNYYKEETSKTKGFLLNWPYKILAKVRQRI